MRTTPDFNSFASKTFPCNIPGFAVCVQRVRSGKNEAIIKAYPVDKDTGARIPGFQDMRHKIRSKKQWHEEAKYMVGRVEEKLRGSKTCGPGNPREKVPDGPFMKAYLSIDDSMTLCKANWAITTMDKTLTDTRAVLTRMDELKVGLDVCNADMEEIRNRMVEEAMGSKNSSKKWDIVSRGINDRFARAGIIYQNLRRATTDYFLPDVSFLKANIALVIQPEQCKFLPDKVRIKAAAQLPQRVQEGCALGAGLMLAAGPRTSEAAAGCFGNLICNGDGYSLPILWQQGKGGVILERLKSDAGYRILPLPLYMAVLIDKRKNYLRELGYSEENIAQMPFVADDNDPSKMAPSSKLSAYIKNLLKECGLTDEYLLAAQELQAREPDNASAGEILDVGAYVLRRDFATRACNICGFEPREVDYLLGHANKANDSRDYQTPQAQRKLRNLLENYVLYPQYSGHPAFQPVEIPREELVAFEKTAQFAIRATEDVQIEINVDCCEPDCGITLKSGHPMMLEQMQTHYKKDTFQKRIGRTIVGQIIDNDKLDKWVLKTNETVITDSQEKIRRNTYEQTEK